MRSQEHEMRVLARHVDQDGTATVWPQNVLRHSFITYRTQEVKALHDSYTEINRNTPAKAPKGRIFISKAVILLCLAKKSRDADHLQNFVYDRQAGLDPETLTNELEQAGEYVPIPDFAYDCHTPQGRAMGRTKAEFFKAEQEALNPFIPGLFDDLIDS